MGNDRVYQTAEQNRRSQGQNTSTGPTVTGSEIETRVKTAESGTTAGKGLGSLAKTAGMPSRGDYDSQDAWMAAVREWRAKSQANPAVAGQKKALERLAQ